MITNYVVKRIFIRIKAKKIRKMTIWIKLKLYFALSPSSSINLSIVNCTIDSEFKIYKFFLKIKISIVELLLILIVLLS